MAKRESDYDLISDMKNYLVYIHGETLNFAKQYVSEPKDYQFKNIIYLRNHHDLVTGIHDGLYSTHVMQKYKIKEQKKLRSNAQNYIKKYYSDGLLQKIECFVDGSLDCRFIAMYNENKRYLIPVSETGNYYPSYTHVLETHDNYYEEYMVNDVQIVYRKYTRQTNDKYAYLYINYVSEGTYPILSFETGIFNIGEQITYLTEQHYDWYEEFDSKRKQKPFCVTGIPFIINIST